ncbi:hypothetical protein [Streptomyces sp. V3I7]|uniref:hypothetical protein n=1 Tax=Streptomyces sp. V3I7 TaxID=3042278 RepID=UPI002780668E|nr:hypothetical protein [Streptomyces sp. V3I7]MDQ0990902.1 hypothetical protein [Streptomyces sp. V3I7]
MLRGPWRTLKVSALAWLGVVTVLAAPSAAAGTAGDRTAGDAPQVSCAWPAVVAPGRLNIAFPESNATYWLMPYRLGEGDRIVVNGTYPAARFTSLTAYDAKGSPIDSLADDQIAPSAGSMNPFAVPDAGPNPARHRYRVTLKPGTEPGSGQNTLAATAKGAASGSGWLALRIYVPDRQSDPTGGVALPTLSVQRHGSAAKSLSACPRSGSTQGPAGPVADEARSVVEKYAPRGGFGGCGAATASDPGFAEPNKTGGLFPNPYNAYLCTPLAYKEGRVAVVRGKAPTFPDTANGQSVLTKSQLRYWSLCQNQVRLPYPVSSCAADFQTVRNKDGRYTYVVSTKQDRPADATMEHGVTWLDWGPTNVESLLIMRNMLPERSFTNAVQDVGKGEDPAKVMGAYYPIVTYCTKASFDKSGPGSCTA